MRRSARNVSICRRKPPLMPRTLVVQRLVAIEADGDDRACRAAARDPLDGLHDAIGEETVGRESAAGRAVATPARRRRGSSSMSGRRKISPPVRSAQVMSGFSRTNASTSSVVSSSVGLRCQMLQVLAPVLAPVGQAQVDLRRRGRPRHRGAEERRPEVRGSTQGIDSVQRGTRG